MVEPCEPVRLAHAPSAVRQGPTWTAGRLIWLGAHELELEDAESSLRLGWAPGTALPELSVGDLLWLRLCPASAPGSNFLADMVLLAAHGHLRPGGEHQRRPGRALRSRAAALAAARHYFDGQDFLEVETPVRVPAPGLDLHVEALSAHQGFLITSPEHHMKRLLVAGAPRIYQIARASRAEELGPLHQPEFTLLEWYRAYAGMAAVMHDTESLVRRLVAAAKRPAGAAAHGAEASELHYQGRVIDLTAPFPRLSVRDAFRQYAGVEDVVSLAEQNEDRYFDLLVERIEPALARFEQPVFLHGYPRSQASLARPDPADPDTAERFELYLAGVELCNGFGELNDAAEQRRRYQAALAERQRRGMPVYPMDEPFLDALEEGMPPAGGNALGLDRLLMLALDQTRLQAVAPFALE